ncbi:MAG TPA: Xaa-Pro peptidase family protein [Terriglobia bacterium]|nr:Xaa-Pro peptidase family protein [Terriglobia bacterium]
MINTARRQQFLELMEKSGWDVLVLYGHSWRKDFFRSLVNFNFFGPHAAVMLSRSGELSILVAHPWDQEVLARSIDVRVRCATEFESGFRGLVSEFRNAKTAIAGMEFMEARFVDPGAVSATAAIEALRRIKTSEEIEIVRQAVRLADIGYQYFVDVIKVGMAEYELVAEVEGFLKERGAEDNFMLIGSGGTEVFGMRPPTDRRFQIGDNVTTELSPQVNGYFAQICRTLVLGEPSENQSKSFSIFREAQQAAEDFLKPGVNIRDVARVQNDVFRREGYGEFTGAKYTRVRGHNLGLYPDENPYVLEDVDCEVGAGMVLIAHPNTYLPLSGYMVFGDTLVVTDDGCVRLGQTEKKLFSKEA